MTAGRNSDHGRPCVTGTCPTDVQGGTEGMLAHLQVLHHPDMGKDELEDLYSLELWPEIAEQAGE